MHGKILDFIRGPTLDCIYIFNPADCWEVPVDFARDLVFPNHLDNGDNLFSATKAFRLTLTNGNLVLAALDDRTIPRDSIEGGRYNPFWDAGVALADTVVPTAHADMQQDGNFVIYASFIPEGEQPVWDTRSNGNPGAFLRCQDDGNLVVYASDGRALWASSTNARR